LYSVALKVLLASLRTLRKEKAAEGLSYSMLILVSIDVESSCQPLCTSFKILKQHLQSAKRYIETGFQKHLRLKNNKKKPGKTTQSINKLQQIYVTQYKQTAKLFCRM